MDVSRVTVPVGRGWADRYGPVWWPGGWRPDWFHTGYPQTRHTPQTSVPRCPPQTWFAAQSGNPSRPSHPASAAGLCLWGKFTVTGWLTLHAAHFVHMSVDTWVSSSYRVLNIKLTINCTPYRRVSNPLFNVSSGMVGFASIVMTIHEWLLAIISTDFSVFRYFWWDVTVATR